MHFSKIQTVVFFAVILAIGWLIYPREFFLGYISEGTTEGFKQAESYYRRYLDFKPGDKRVTLRLADLYSRMNLPEKATPLLESLSLRRVYDWEVAMHFLDHLDQIHEQDKAYEVRRALAGRFLKSPKPNKAGIEAMLRRAYHYARWKQKDEKELYEILIDLMQAAANPMDYKSEMRTLDWAFKKSSKISFYLIQKLALGPANSETRLELASIWMVQGKFAKALKLIDEGLDINRHLFEFYRMRLLLNERLGRPADMISDIDRALEFSKMSAADRMGLLGQQASLYAETHQPGKALTIYRAILKEVPSRRENWINVFYMLSDLKKTDEALTLAEEYLQKFDDPDIEANVVSLYLYEKKDVGRLPYYRAMIAQHHKRQWALDVGWLLASRGNPHGAAAWFHDMLRLFPSDEELETSRIGTLVQAGEKERALAAARYYLQKNSSHYEVMMNLAGLLAEAGFKDEAVAHYEKWLGHAGRTALNLKKVGMALVFADDLSRGLEFLQKSADKNGGDPETHFWNAEASYALGRKERGVRAAKEVVTLLSAKSRLSLEEKRWFLKSRSHLGFGEDVLADYASLLQKHPRDLDVRSDYLDVLLEHKKYSLMRIVLSTAKTVTRGETDRIDAYRARLALATRDYKRALVLYEAIRLRHPGAYQKDLAETHAGLGEGRKAIALYENYFLNHAGLIEDRRRLRDLRRVWDDQVNTRFSLRDFGADSLWEWTTEALYSFKRQWWFLGEATTGQYKSPAIGFNDMALRGKAGIRYENADKIRVDVLAGAGASPVRQTPTAETAVHYKFSENFVVTGGLRYRLLRNDIPQALGQGDLQDAAHVSFTLTPLPRLILGGSYEFTRDYLPGGEMSLGHAFTPQMSWLVFRKPALTLGYQFTLASQSDKRGFLSQVALLPEVRAHYVSARIGGYLDTKLWAEAGVFAGEDTARNLHLLDGDLWGFRAHALYEVFSWLDFEGSYDYGRETLNQVGGQSQQVTLGFKGHWN